MIEQFGIAFFGLVAVFLTQHPRATWRRWACIFGLAGQPFWIMASSRTEQWGILFTCGLYTAVWGYGVWVNWVRKDADKTSQA